MIQQDYHMHTVYCDGNNTAEEMARAAIDAGLTEIGFSGHSHTPFDESYCMSQEATQRYRQELMLLREKYADQISIKIGLEMDRWSDADTAGFDYLIGSMHYIRVPTGKASPEEALNGKGSGAPEGCLPWEEDGKQYVFIPVDETPEILRAAADTYFDGDMIALAEMYFSEVASVAETTGCDIIGHFDLITKFNEPNALIDTEDPRYVAAWKKAADLLLPYGVPFEINTGAMSKGYRSTPYPAKPIRDYIRAKGGRFILSSDSHSTQTLRYAFDQYESEL